MMAVVRPSAVLTSASLMPSASCVASGAPARDMAWNERIMPMVVPSRPSRVAIEAMVDSAVRLRSRLRALQGVGLLQGPPRLVHGSPSCRRPRLRCGW